MNNQEHANEYPCSQSVWWLVKFVCIALMFFMVGQTTVAAEIDASKNVDLGVAALQRTDYEEAIRLFTQTITKEGVPTATVVNAYLYRGNAYFLKGEYERAIVDYSSAIVLGEGGIDAFHDRALAYQINGNYKQAVVDYSSAIRLKGDDPELFYQRGVSYYQMGQYAYAIEDFTKAVELKPGYASAFYARGKTFAALGQYRRSLSDYEKAIRLEPGFIDAYLDRAISFIAVDEYAKAITDINYVIRLEPNNTSAYHYRGGVYSRMGEYEKAITDFNEVIRLNSKHYKAYFNRAGVYTKIGNVDRAIEDYTASIRLDPVDVVALYNRASLYFQEADYERAIEDLTDAIAKKSDFAQAYLTRGISRFIMGRFDEAAADFGSRASLEPISAYAPLWYYIARGKTGERDDDGLKRMAEKLDGEEWPWVILALFWGEVTPDKVRATAAESDPDMRQARKCQSDFYIAEYEIFHGYDRSTSVASLKQIVSECPHDLIEYRVAISELERMGITQ